MRPVSEWASSSAALWVALGSKLAIENHEFASNAADGRAYICASRPEGGGETRSGEGEARAPAEKPASSGAGVTRTYRRRELPRRGYRRVSPV